MERTEILSLKTLEAVKEELFNLISIPSHREFSKILEYLEKRLDYIQFEKQPVKDKDYNLISIDPSRPVLINTHVDTVPPIRMKNPFKPVEIDGKIYGRGAADTKGLIASLIVALDLFRDRYPDREIPVSLAFTVDEEQNSALGSEVLVNNLEGIDYAVVLEPTYGKICVKQMGTVEFKLKVKSDSYHASEFERADNPVKKVFSAIKRIESRLGREVNILSFRSGWEHYATPDEAEVLAEIKVYEGEKADQLEKLIKGTVEKELDVNYKGIDKEDFISFPEGFIFRKLCQAYRAVIGKEPQTGVMPSWTDAANFKKAGIECVIFGFGSLADCHTEREYITVEELKSNTAVLYSLLTILSQSR
ncbi:MAG TPA: succinyl-diaminopimelate desuccinylase [Persephonella sp.]|uniref:M20 family metallopeptidase n=1 Tax=Persephonella TaxID=182899 RepID=UPI00067413FB|nr:MULTISPECIES: M20 family metallopeptidase [Persephonella]HCB70557.1 succinyl-diaminopimelate desuccinylase [Persephonella sp.]